MKKGWWFPLLFLLITLISGCAGRFDYYQWGLKLEDQGRFKEAALVHKKAIEQDPEHGLAYNHLGISLYEQGHIDEAIAAYRKAIQFLPLFDDAYYNLGMAYLRKGL